MSIVVVALAFIASWVATRVPAQPQDWTDPEPGLFGASVIGVADLDEDGVRDLAIFAPLDSAGGSVHLFRSSGRFLRTIRAFGGGLPGGPPFLVSAADGADDLAITTRQAGRLRVEGHSLTSGETRWALPPTSAHGEILVAAPAPDGVGKGHVLALYGSPHPPYHDATLADCDSESGEVKALFHVGLVSHSTIHALPDFDHSGIGEVVVSGIVDGAVHRKALLLSQIDGEWKARWSLTSSDLLAAPHMLAEHLTVLPDSVGAADGIPDLLLGDYQLLASTSPDGERLITVSGASGRVLSCGLSARLRRAKEQGLGESFCVIERPAGQWTVLVGSPLAAGTGAVASWNPASPDALEPLPAPEPRNRFGAGLFAVGDVTGDGGGDFVVSTADWAAPYEFGVVDLYDGATLAYLRSFDLASTKDMERAEDDAGK